MSENKKVYFVQPNEPLQGYDIMKRDGVEKPDGTLEPERICTVYSMEYFDAILEKIAELDADGIVEYPEDERYIDTAPIIEIDNDDL